MSRVALATLLILSLSIGCSGNRQKKAEGIRDAEFYYGLAVNWYYDQNAQAALSELQTCFAKDPDYLDAHNLAGLIYLGRKEYLDSLRHFEKALSIKKDFHIARANLGALHMAMQNWEEAMKTLTPLLSEPMYGTPYLAENNIGWCHFKLKNYGEAERHLKRALFLNDKLCLAYNNLGILDVELDRLDDAAEAFDAAIARCPEFTEAFFRLGSVLERQGYPKEASAKFEKCRKLGKDSPYGRRCKRKLQVMR
jgi:type IV pilus assembly protein PilF